MTAEELQFAQAVRQAIPQMLAADLVVVLLPDGTEFVARGDEKLEEVIASGIERKLLRVQINGPSLEFAVALQGVLAEVEAGAVGRTRH